MDRWTKQCAALLACAVIAGAPRTASAGGLAVNEASARLTGTGYAGTAALAEEASMAWYNPAGLTRLEGGSAVFSGSVIKLDTLVSVDPGGATTWGESGITGPYGNMDAQGGDLVAIPNFHIAQRVHEKAALYLGVVAPWGDQTNFPTDSAVRYLGTLSELRTININPAVAVGPWEGFSATSSATRPSYGGIRRVARRQVGPRNR